MIALERFLAQVEQCLGGGVPPRMLARDEAARTVLAVLGVLVPRLSRDERRRLVAELPPELTELIELAGGAPSAGDVLEQVAVELGVDAPTAERRVRCVVQSLRDCLSGDTWRSLPPDVGALAR
jgi:uncharacterized protein (DUF2267 family)